MGGDAGNGQGLTGLPLPYCRALAGTGNQYQNITAVTQAGATQADAIRWWFGGMVYGMY